MPRKNKNSNLSIPAGHLPKHGENTTSPALPKAGHPPQVWGGQSGISIGCHVSASGGVWNAPKNAFDLGCETFQIFTRPPMGGPAPKLDDVVVEKFKMEMVKYFPGFNSPPKVGGDKGVVFVVHCPYFVNFGSAKKTTYHGSISVVSEELIRANLLGAKYVMTHLGSFKDLGQAVGMKQAQAGLKSVLEKYEGNSDATVGGVKTKFLLEISAGAGEVIGDTFEELAELMEPLVKFKTFGGICFDTQHAFSSGYDLRNANAVTATFSQFDKLIGLKWLKMSHMNDSKVELSGKKDRHEHIGEGKIGEKGFKAIISYFTNLCRPAKGGAPSPSFGEGKNVAFGAFPLILETEHDKVKTDLKILKQLRDKTLK